MKKLSTLIFITCCFLSCTKDDANKNPLEGRWYYQQIIYADFASDKVVSSTGNLVDCKGNSYYDISNNRVSVKEFLSCEKWNTFQGTFNSENNQITIGNRSTEFTIYDVQLENEKLVLTETTSS